MTDGTVFDTRDPNRPHDVTGTASRRRFIQSALVAAAGVTTTGWSGAAEPPPDRESAAAPDFTAHRRAEMFPWIGI